MHATGFTRPTSPMHFGHRCDKCRQEEWIVGTSYPRIECEEEIGFGAD